MQPCAKEREIEDMQKLLASNRDILIQLKTLVETLVDYQLKENKKVLDNHETRLTKVENLGVKITSWASIGGVIGGLIFNIISKLIFK